MREFRAAKVGVDLVMTGTSVVSATVDVEMFKSGAIQFVWTGTPNGTFDILGSVDGVNFKSLGLTITAATGAAGNNVVDLQHMGFAFLKAEYTNASSTGTLQIWFVGKPN